MNTDLRPAVGHPRVIGGSLVAGPLLMLAGDALALLGQQGLQLWSGFLLFLSAYGFAGVVLGLYRLSGDRLGALVGALLALFGSFVMAAITGFDRALWSMRAHDFSAESIRQVATEPSAFLLTRPIGITFPIGMITLTILVMRTGHLTRLRGLALILGIVLFPVGRVYAGPAVNVVSDAIMLSVLGPLALHVWNLPTPAKKR